MLTQVDVFNARNARLSLPLSGVGSPYRVLGVDGLDPIKAEISTSKFANLDGEQFQAARGGMRNIVITLGFAPDYATQDIASLRNALYAYFMPKSSVRVRLASTHMATVEIAGYVESCAAPIFTQEPAVQVSIICTKPDFINKTQKVINGSGIGYNVPITYLGTVQTGVILQFTLSDDAQTWGFRTNDDAFIVNGPPFNPLYSMPGGSTCNVSTVPGNKYATCSGDTGIPRMLSNIGNSSVWPQLKPGVASFRFDGPAGSPWQVSYYERYGGI